MIRSRRIREAGYVALMDRKEMNVGYLWEREHLEDKDVHGCIILKLI
jgi:hypothetical protein